MDTNIYPIVCSACGKESEVKGSTLAVLASVKGEVHCRHCGSKRVDLNTRTASDSGMPEPGWGSVYGGKEPSYMTQEAGPVWMFRKGQRVRYYDALGRQVGPEQSNVAPAMAYAESQGWTYWEFAHRGSKTAENGAQRSHLSCYVHRDRPAVGSYVHLTGYGDQGVWWPMCEECKNAPDTDLSQGEMGDPVTASRKTAGQFSSEEARQRASDAVDAAPKCSQCGHVQANHGPTCAYQGCGCGKFTASKTAAWKEVQQSLFDNSKRQTFEWHDGDYDGYVQPHQTQQMPDGQAGSAPIEQWSWRVSGTPEHYSRTKFEDRASGYAPTADAAKKAAEGAMGIGSTASKTAVAPERHLIDDGKGEFAINVTGMGYTPDWIPGRPTVTPNSYTNMAAKVRADDRDDAIAKFEAYFTGLGWTKVTGHDTHQYATWERHLEMNSSKTANDNLDWIAADDQGSGGWPGASDDGYVDGYGWGQSGRPLVTPSVTSERPASYVRGIQEGYADGIAGKKPRIEASVKADPILADILRNNPGLPTEAAQRLASKVATRYLGVG